MNTSVKSGFLMAVLFTGFAAFRPFAQERAITTTDLEATYHLLDE